MVFQKKFLADLRTLLAGSENAGTLPAGFVGGIAGEGFKPRVQVFDDSAVRHHHRVDAVLDCW